VLLVQAEIFVEFLQLPFHNAVQDSLGLP